MPDYQHSTDCTCGCNIQCPCCGSKMNRGDPCPECDHVDNDATCTCDHCIMQEEEPEPEDDE